MREIYADLHIHIGRTETGRPVKISGASNLTFRNIAEEASARKGIEMIGIIDCQSPSVQQEIMMYLDRGEMREIDGGGIAYGETTIMLGSEIEVRDPGMGPAHLLVYMPTLEAMSGFTAWLGKHMRNVELSSQRVYVPARVLQEEATGRGGILVPAHIFTPHRSIYGSCTDRMADLLELGDIEAGRLGLSADSEMAGYLSELDRFTYVTNSDAHSLGKIGREYNQIAMRTPSFEELRLALRQEEGRGIVANYGLNPRLGKYHRTYCASCEEIVDEDAPGATRCAYCGSPKIVRGVLDRIESIADREQPYVPSNRPPYRYQIPLEFMPGVGPKTLRMLLNAFGTEMNVLHRVPIRDLAAVAGEKVAALIDASRNGTLNVNAGGGGTYGKVDIAPAPGSE